VSASLSVSASTSARSSASCFASMYQPAQPPIIRRSVGPHTHTLILLHGLGDTGNGWSDLGAQLPVRGLKMIFPTARERPVTLNGGLLMTAWFDINSLSALEAKEDRDGFEEATAYIESLISAEEAAGVPRQRVFLAGFSQGGAVALHVGLRSSQPLAGVLALSAWLPLATDYPAALGAGAAATHFLLCHGSADQVVRTTYGVRSYEQIKTLGIPVDFKLYPGLAHSACPQELEDVGAFLSSRL